MHQPHKSKGRKMGITNEEAAELIAMTLEDRPEKDKCWICGGLTTDMLICIECDIALSKRGI